MWTPIEHTRRWIKFINDASSQLRETAKSTIVIETCENGRKSKHQELY